MTSRWLICFSLIVLSLPAAEVSGKVVLRDSREGSVRKQQDFSGVVISLVLKGALPTPAAPKRAKMDQRNKTFIPHLLPIQVGAIVDFPNNDPIFHNAFSSYSGQIFDIGLYPPGKSRAVKFSRPGVVRVFCNIHASMSAVIVVLDTPYFAVTQHSGQFAVEVPSGSYELNVFHERATEQTLRSLSRTLRVESEKLCLPPIVISEAGYLPTQHNNKYGRPYPPQQNDTDFYTGVKK